MISFRSAIAALIPLIGALPLTAPAQQLVADLSADGFAEVNSQGQSSWKDDAGKNHAISYADKTPSLSSETTPTGRKTLAFDGRQFLYFPGHGTGKPVAFYGGIDTASFSSAPNFSILAVIKIERYVQTTMTILGGGNRSIQYGIASAGAGGGQTLDMTLVGPVARSSEPVPTETWTVIGVAYDGTTVTFYQDSKLVETIPTAGETFELPPADIKFHIGNTLRQHYFVGLMAALRIYEGALSESEMKKNSMELRDLYIGKP